MDPIKSLEVFPLSIPRLTPYLGPLEEGVIPNDKGYFVRPGNKSIYSIHDHSVLVKLTTESGLIGWGETYSIVGPQATAIIIRDVLSPFVLGRDPHDVVSIYEDMYNAMHVRGFFGGFYVDAVAGVDIALWDLRGKMVGLPLTKLLGGQRHERLPAYVSGLPRATREERAALAKEWIDKGFKAIKFAAAVAHDGELAEIQAIRAAVGPGPHILCDFHWRYTAQEAIRLIASMEPYDLYVAEAPCEPEDLDGQAAVAASVKPLVAIGEEYHTVFEYRPRFTSRCMSVIQPEIAHMGVTAFYQTCQMARAFHVRVMPHASIGIGIFQAASLHVSACLPNLVYHEYQHSIFDKT
jgi:L-alanine-DL-glutamate epimerase-like enolase superfamily enzyme